jgi:hypothetical protein
MNEPNEGQTSQRQQVRAGDVPHPVVALGVAIEEHPIRVGEGADERSQGEHERSHDQHDEQGTSLCNASHSDPSRAEQQQWCPFETAHTTGVQCYSSMRLRWALWDADRVRGATSR